MKILLTARLTGLICCLLLLFSACKKENIKDRTKGFIGSYTGTAQLIVTSFPGMTSQTITDYTNCNITIQGSGRKTVLVTIKDNKVNPVNVWSVEMEIVDINHLGNLSNNNNCIPGYFNNITLDEGQLSYHEEATELRKFTFHGTRD